MKYTPGLPENSSHFQSPIAMAGLPQADGERLATRSCAVMNTRGGS
jgi:hypothetical protein